MAKKKPTAADIKSQYGFVALLARSVPEVNGVLKRAIREKWTPQRFSMAVADTRWWKTTSADRREWITQKIADPASAKAAQWEGGRMVQGRAELLGIPVPSMSKAQQIWLSGTLYGFEGAELDGYIFREGVKGRDLVAGIKTWGGRFGEVANEMLSAAFDYGYLGSTWETSSWGRKAAQDIADEAADILSKGGTANTERWLQKMQNFAAAKYSPFADRIQAGQSVREIAQPYIEAVSNTLELNPNDVGLDERLIEQALQGRKDENGQATGMTVWQVEQAARKDERWRTTKNANDAVGSLLTELGKRFGKVGS